MTTRIGKAILVGSVFLLTGCPPSWSLLVVNNSGAQVELVSASSRLVIPDRQRRLVRQDAFAFDRIPEGPEKFVVDGNFGTSCHKLDFHSLGLTDEELGVPFHTTVLSISRRGGVFVVAQSRNPTRGRNPRLEALPRCEPARQ
jgi:hypothetical protein